MKDEQNYHIFYCMLAGMSAEEKQQLELRDATDYFYLIQVSAGDHGYSKYICVCKGEPRRPLQY